MAQKPMTVLLVEDNPGDAIPMRRMLAALGPDFSIAHVSKLSDCLKQLQNGGIDLVLLDLTLPDSWGLETLTRTRAQNQAIPIIVITGLSEREIAVKALNQGAQDFIAKERLEEHLLGRAVERWAGRRLPLPANRRQLAEASRASER